MVLANAVRAVTESNAPFFQPNGLVIFPVPSKSETTYISYLEKPVGGGKSVVMPIEFTVADSFEACVAKIEAANTELEAM